MKEELEELDEIEKLSFKYYLSLGALGFVLVGSGIRHALFYFLKRRRS